MRGLSCQHTFGSLSNLRESSLRLAHSTHSAAFLPCSPDRLSSAAKSSLGQRTDFTQAESCRTSVYSQLPSLFSCWFSAFGYWRGIRGHRYCRLVFEAELSGLLFLAEGSSFRRLPSSRDAESRFSLVSSDWAVTWWRCLFFDHAVRKFRVWARIYNWDCGSLALHHWRH